MQVNNVKNIYSTTAGALLSSPCAVEVPEEAPGKRQQYKRARVLNQYGRAESANAEKKRSSVIVPYRRSIDNWNGIYRRNIETTDTPPSKGQCAVYRRFQHSIKPTVLIRTTEIERVRK